MGDKMEYNIDLASMHLKGRKTKIYIKGWVHTSKYQILIKSKGRIISDTCKQESRYDICMTFHEKIVDNTYGFVIDTTIESPLKKIEIYLMSQNHEIKIGEINNGRMYQITNRFQKMFTMFKKAIRFFWKEYHFLIPPSMLKKYFGEFIHKTKAIKNENMSCYNPMINKEYWDWIDKYEKMKPLKTSCDDISFIVFTKEKEESQIRACINRIQYLNHNAKIYLYTKQEILDLEDVSYFTDDKKLIASIKTKYVCLLDAHCLLHENFFDILQKEDYTKYELIYFDHDEYNGDKERCNPYFKPDFSKDTLLGTFYIGPCYCLKKTVLKDTFSDELYMILLNIKDILTKVHHVSKIMYHTVNYKVDQEMIYRDLVQYFKKRRMSKKVDLIKNPDNKTVTVQYKVVKQPLVSIIIPTKDHADVLEVCLKSVYEKTTYQNYEIIMLDNNSCERETFDLFDAYERQYENFHVYRLECPFNYSYINNEGVKYSKGEYIVLLNNDTEIITPNWLENMLGYAMQDHIGTVGAKLLFSDDTIQHAGIILGKGGLAGHAHYEKSRYYVSHQWELSVPYDVSASTAACLMIQKKKFLEVGGLEEKLAVAFNDVDFNMKIGKKGYQNIYLPSVELYHYESKSRGLDTTPEKQKRFMQEWQYMTDKWSTELKNDKYYNKNFSLTYDYMLEANGEVNDEIE